MTCASCLYFSGTECHRRGADQWCSEHSLRQRDHLAAMAMQGLCAAHPDTLTKGSVDIIADRAYAIADAILHVRARVRAYAPKGGAR